MERLFPRQEIQDHMVKVYSGAKIPVSIFVEGNGY